MNISTFPVYSTNIFPLANDSKAGGQYMTEYNLRTRESVGTSQNVKYMIGPSFVHSKEDFLVRIQEDGAGVQISSTTLEILPGRAVVNGHFIESLETVTLDIASLNAQAKLQDQPPISGTNLCIGLRAMYSTEQTMAGAMRANNTEDIYEGIQVVILPRNQFKLPEDVPDQEDQVTAHILLATFNYVNEAINTVVDNYPDKCRYISSDRLGDLEGLLSDVYVTKNGLNPKKLYVFSGKGTDPQTGKDTWCEANDSLMVWDRAPELTTQAQSAPEASFGIQVATGKTVLVLPHKQVDGMTDINGNKQYYKDKTIELPLADYSTGTSGTVNKAYTNHIKEVQEQIHNIYRMPNGKQVGYLSVLNNISDLPTLNTNWNPGDYILVGQDNTVEDASDSVRAPSTMYVVIPGQVQQYTYLTMTTDDTKIPSSLTGIELGRDYLDTANGDIVDTSNPDVYGQYFDISEYVRGQINKDYFVINLTDGNSIKRYYYKVSQAGPYTYSDPMFVTGQIPLAQEDVIGGFYNVPDTSVDSGYVWRDDTGHLRLLDYELLRSGTLAYQLGEDYESPASISTSDIQQYLDEYVNNRIVFPNAAQQQKENPTVINVTLDISEEDEDSTINIYQLDSRFGGSVYLHINGSAGSNCTINIADCQKIRIDQNIGGSPVINLYRSCLYYDSQILNRLNEIEDLTLWYTRYEDTDPNLLVNDMTVQACDDPVIPDDIDFWNESTPNDNHFMYALQSITFGGDGNIIGCGLFVKNETSANISEGNYVITSTFEIPQGAGLTYPQKRLNKQIKVTGSFVNSYVINDPSGYMVLDTNFSALSQTYDPYSDDGAVKGSIAFYVRAMAVTNVTGMPAGTSIDAWESNAFHCFWGTVI